MVDLIRTSDKAHAGEIFGLGLPWTPLRRGSPSFDPSEASDRTET